MARRNSSGQMRGTLKNSASADRRTGGKSSEFSSKRDVNKGNFRGGTTAGGKSPSIRGSAQRSAPFNGSNVYGILSRGGGASTGSAYGAGKGNATFGSGSARASAGPTAPTRRTGRRGGR